jgi:flagellar biosynthesis chaperone FliJ
MRRFVWRLQRVLDIKAKEEIIRTQELFVITEKLAQTRSELLIQQRALREIFESIAGEFPKNRIFRQEFFLRNSAATDEKIRQIRDEINKLELEQKKKVAEVLKIRRFKESLERLREQAKKKFMEEQEKLEQKQLDETATLSFGRQSNIAAWSADKNAE